MAYGHAERALATIRRLEAETRELLLGLDELDQEQAQWLAETAPDRRDRPRHKARQEPFAATGGTFDSGCDLGQDSASPYGHCVSLLEASYP